VYCPRQWCQGAARSKKHPKTDDIDMLQALHRMMKKSHEIMILMQTKRHYRRLANVLQFVKIALCILQSLQVWLARRIRPLFPRRKYELTAEEKASEEYMKLHTSPCPTCMAPCQKTMGCNHMICFKCNTHFCYLCSAWLDTGNPTNISTNSSRPVSRGYGS
jgi:E3 ubiquitin-protein ligase RNF14